jgi:uncharacterized protein (DUF2235 family)
MSKRLIYCFDGTWNRIESEYPTNVARIAQAILPRADDGKIQTIYYDEGVGTSDAGKITSKIGNYLAGAMGWGLKENIIEAYTHLVFNYEPGDEIFVFGFSRGAFTARSFCGLIRNCAIVNRRNLKAIREAVDNYTSRLSEKAPSSLETKAFRYRNCKNACLETDVAWLEKAFPDHDHAAKPRISINYLGVWDTVGALGIPKRLSIIGKINRKYQFHDTNLSKLILSARHAVAADEKRGTFSKGQKMPIWRLT